MVHQAASLLMRTGWCLLRGTARHLAVAGALINALYLSGVYLALERIPALTVALIVSLGAPALLMLMLRHNKAAIVASNFYVTPALTAGMGWLFLGEVLRPWAVAGFALAMLGVWLAYREVTGKIRSDAQT